MCAKLGNALGGRSHLSHLKECVLIRQGANCTATDMFKITITISAGGNDIVISRTRDIIQVCTCFARLDKLWKSNP